MANLPKSLHLCSAIARRQYITARTPASAASAFPIFHPRSLIPCTYRNLSTSLRLTYPRKDSQHKDSINTEATEYSKSATDDEGARQEEAAFDPNITDPEAQKEKAGEGNGVSLQIPKVDGATLANAFRYCALYSTSEDLAVTHIHSSMGEQSFNEGSLLR